MVKIKVSGLEERIRENDKNKCVRLRVSKNKFAYVFVKTNFYNGQFIIHLIDRLHVNTGVSILDCILDVQVEIIEHLGAKEFAYKFINNSKWILYGKDGEVKEFIYGEQERINHVFTAGLSEEFLELTLERKGKEIRYDLLAVI